ISLSSLVSFLWVGAARDRVAKAFRGTSLVEALRAMLGLDSAGALVVYVFALSSQLAYLSLDGSSDDRFDSRSTYRLDSSNFLDLASFISASLLLSFLLRSSSRSARARSVRAVPPAARRAKSV